MKRILLVTDIFPPDIGGPATFVEHLAEELVKRGHRPTVMCASESATDPEDQRRSYTVVRTRRADRFFKARFYSRLLTKASGCDRVFSNGLEFPATRVAALLRKPIVVKFVGDSVWETARNLALTNDSILAFQARPPAHPILSAQAAKRLFVIRRSSRILTPSHNYRDLAIGWGAPPEKVHVVHNGVELPPENARPPERVAGEPLRVVFCGRLTNIKGVETLLLAMQGLDGIKLEIVGDGPEMPLLYDLHIQLGLEGTVKFRGRVRPKDIPPILAENHVLCLPSSVEGLSHTLLEACAAGLTCIVSAAGGNLEVIRDNQNGLSHPYGDYRLLRNHLTTLRNDDGYRIALGLKALEGIRHFDFAVTVARTIEHLESV